MPGPAASPHARRTNARPDWVKLPAAGYCGDVPVWPLPFEPSLAAQSAWDDIWTTPQAHIWSRGGYARMVARYVVMLVNSELPDAAASLLAEVRQMEDRLGLSPMALKRLQWEIGDGPASAAAAAGSGATVISLEDHRDF